jgi:hypothetical protein
VTQTRRDDRQWHSLSSLRVVADRGARPLHEMEALQNLWRGTAPDNEPSKSVLAEWNSYSSGKAPPVEAKQLAAAEEGTASSTVSSLLSGAVNVVSAAASGGAALVTNSVQK